jgi:intracellular multiplication protein IcmV
MGFFSRTGKILKPLVDIPRWMDLPRLAENGKMIVDIAKQLIVPQKAKRTETFEEAMVRLRLSKADISQRTQEFKRLFIIFLVIFIVLLSYTVYLFSEGSIRPGLVSLVLTFIVLAQIFRYHFWLFQIKQRKLGCTLREWFWQGLLGR